MKYSTSSSSENGLQAAAFDEMLARRYRNITQSASVQAGIEITTIYINTITTGGIYTSSQHILYFMYKSTRLLRAMLQLIEVKQNNQKYFENYLPPVSLTSFPLLRKGLIPADRTTI
jgi:hypothetical protein